MGYWLQLGLAVSVAMLISFVFRHESFATSTTIPVHVAG